MTYKRTNSANMYEFPMLLRAHLGQFLSLGIGGYYAQATGEVTTETEINGIKSTQTSSFADSNQTTSDHGLVTSLALTLRMAPLTYFLLDARYTLGMKNNSTSAGGDRKYNDMQLLAGLQFGF